jgi:nicotinate-nucleotide--dimethylbenzimidazole phosphoribosyltransferase
MLFQSPIIDNLNRSELEQRLQFKLDNKTKPLGSLGRLEALALQLGEILGTHSPVLDQPQMVVFAADHGITAQGVSAFPSEVSWQMVENFLAGGAAVSVLARQHGLALTVVDCGVKHDFLAGLPAGSQRPGLQVRKADGAHLGTADSSQQPAMRAAQCAQALRHGVDLVQGLPGNVLLLGEMGIGNTTAASKKVLPHKLARLRNNAVAKPRINWPILVHNVYHKVRLIECRNISFESNLT